MDKCKTGKSEKTRANILATAVSVFSEKGLSGSRIDEIADQAEINKERIYAYFGSKELLFEAALISVYSQSAACDQKLTALSEEDIPEMGEKIISHYLSSYKKHPEFWRMIAWTNLEQIRVPNALKSIKSESIEHIRKLFLHGQKSGYFAENCSFEMYIYMLWALTFFINANRKTLVISLADKISGSDFLKEIVRTGASCARAEGKKVK